MNAFVVCASQKVRLVSCECFRKPAPWRMTKQLRRPFALLLHLFDRMLQRRHLANDTKPHHDYSSCSPGGDDRRGVTGCHNDVFVPACCPRCPCTPSRPAGELSAASSTLGSPARPCRRAAPGRRTASGRSHHSARSESDDEREREIVRDHARTCEIVR